MIDSTSRRECHTSNAERCAIFAISLRYSAEQPSTAVLPSPSESAAVLAATTKLAASRMTSHSHGPGWVSSKSFRSKTWLRSGVAKVPKLRRCASPQICSTMPVDGVRLRSAAMTAGEPR